MARAGVVRQAEAAEKAREKLARVDELIDAARSEIGRHLAGLGGSIDRDEPLAALIARARATANRVIAASGLDRDRDRLAKAGADVAVWRSRWAAAVDALGLGLDVSANRANSVLDRLEKLIKAFEIQTALVAEIAESERSESRLRRRRPGDARSAGSLAISQRRGRRPGLEGQARPGQGRRCPPGRRLRPARSRSRQARSSPG